MGTKFAHYYRSINVISFSVSQSATGYNYYNLTTYGYIHAERFERLRNKRFKWNFSWRKVEQHDFFNEDEKPVLCLSSSGKIYAKKLGEGRIESSFTSLELFN